MNQVLGPVSRLISASNKLISRSNRINWRYCWYLALILALSNGAKLLSNAHPRIVGPPIKNVAVNVSANPQQDLAGETVTLRSGQIVEKTIFTREVDHYVVDLPAEHYLAVAVEQQGVDVILRIFDPQGKIVLTANRALGEYGTERLYFINEKVGRHQLVITRFVSTEFPSSAPKAQYRLVVEALRKATADDAALLEAEDRGLEAQDLARGERYLEARKLWEQILQVQEKALGKQHPAVAATLDEIGYTYYAQKDYRQSLTFYQRSLAIREQALGKDHPEVADVVHNIGTLYYQQKEYLQALPWYQRALAIREKTLGAAHLDTLTVWNNLALLYYQQSDYPRAIATYQQILTIREQASGTDSLELVSTLRNIAGLYFQQGNFPQAIPFYERALRIQEKPVNADKRTLNNLSIADTLQPLALSYFQQGEYLTALPLYQRLLALREQEFGKDDPEVAAVLASIGFIYYQQENYAAATPIYQRSLAIVEKAAASENLQRNPQIASALQSLGFLYYEQGDYATAESYYRRALQLRESISETAQTGQTAQNDLIKVLNSLALLYFQQEEYELSSNFYQRVLQIREKMLDSEPREVATALNNLALVDTEKRDYKVALARYQRSLEISEKVLGREHAEVANTLSNMGFVCLQQEDYVAAEPLYQRALQIREKLLGLEHADTAAALYNLAFLYYQKLDLAKALMLNQRSLAIREKLLGSEHFEVANSLYNLGLVHQETKDYLAAERCYQRSLSIRKTTLGDEHPLVVLTLQQLVLLYCASQQGREALDLATQASQLREQGLQRVLITGASSRQRLKYWQQVVAETNAILSLHWQLMPQSEAAASLAFNLVLQRKGRVLDAVTKPLSLLRQQLAANEQLLVDQLINLRTQLAIVINRGPSKAGLAKHQARIAGLAQQVQTLESSLRAKNPVIAQLVAQLLPTTTVNWAAIQSKIPINTVLVEFVQYRPLATDLKTAKLTTAGDSPVVPLLDATSSNGLANSTSSTSSTSSINSINSITATSETTATLPTNANLLTSKAATIMPGARYAAYLLAPTGKPQFVDLGSAETIEAAVSSWHDTVVKKTDSSLSEINKEVKPAAQKLYQLLISPLQAYLNQDSPLLLAPDAALHLLPFEALVDAEGKYLIEQREIAYVTSGRDLLLTNHQFTSEQLAIIFAAADYGNGEVGPTISGQTFAPIKAATAITSVEGREIQKVLGGSISSGKAATETALRSVIRPQILHLALSGYLLTQIITVETGTDTTDTTDTKATTSKELAAKELPLKEGVSQPVTAKVATAKPVTAKPVTAKEVTAKEGIPSIPLRSNSLFRTAIFLAGVNSANNLNNVASNAPSSLANNVPTAPDGILNLPEVASLNLLGTKLVVVSQYEPRTGAIISAEGGYYLRRALQLAGSAQQIVSLWPMVEKGQRDLLLDFYQRLKQAGSANKALRQAQLAMLRQPQRRHPYYWAGLVLSGYYPELEKKP